MHGRSLTFLQNDLNSGWTLAHIENKCLDAVHDRTSTLWALITLHYTTLHYIALHYTTLHYITSHYITLHHITSHYITLHHITSHYITLHHITSHYITLHHITSHYITLHHITSHYITLHHITSHYITLHLHYISLHYITLHYITLHYITLHYITLHYITFRHFKRHLRLKKWPVVHQQLHVIQNTANRPNTQASYIANCYTATQQIAATLTISFPRWRHMCLASYWGRTTTDEFNVLPMQGCVRSLASEWSIKQASEQNKQIFAACFSLCLNRAAATFHK